MGLLTRESGGALWFQYDKEWLDRPDAIALSVGYPLRDEKLTGARLEAILDNILPDNPAIRKRVAERTEADGSDPFSLLAVLGRDCVGALQFLPQGESPVYEPMTASPMKIVDVAMLLRRLKDNPLGLGRENAFRISVAGAQEKTALLLWKKRWYMPTGATPTSHILKPQIGKLDNGLDMTHSVENEFFCMRLLRHMGLPVANVEVQDFEDQRALVVERFDRHWRSKNLLDRIPQEDLLQALGIPSHRKYEADGGPGMADIIRFLMASDVPTEDQRLFIKSQLCFWLMGATDGHAKNYSLFLQEGGRFRMAPLYDVMSIEPNYKARQLTKKDVRLAMSAGKKRHYRLDEIQLRHFEETVEHAKLSPEIIGELTNEIINMFDRAVRLAMDDYGAIGPASIPETIIGAMRKRVKAWRFRVANQ